MEFEGGVEEMDSGSGSTTGVGITRELLTQLL